jgi:hypothetical protein
MNKLLIPYCDFHIYIIEQSDDGELFNIGKLKNIGFEIANKDYKYDNYIFSDIDTIPDYNLIKYYCEKLKYPISLALRGTRYTKNINEKENKQMNKETNKQTNKQKIFLGALLGFNDKQFKKIIFFNLIGFNYSSQRWQCLNLDVHMLTKFQKRLFNI